jgi:hypothetical protein
MGRTLGTMITMTTYGTWLRGDQRGWVEDGVTFPTDAIKEDRDRTRLKELPFLFESARVHDIGKMMGHALIDRMRLSIHAMTVESWHCHIVFGRTEEHVADIVKCAKDAVRYGLRVDRPIWTAGYDKRFCFDELSLRTRIEYVERHNVRSGLVAKPWDFIVDLGW